MAPPSRGPMWQDVSTNTAITLAHVIQAAVAPVFLLSGLGALLNVFTGRLARVVDRARAIEADFTGLSGQDRRRAVWELKLLDKRMRLTSAAIALGTVSAMAVCLVVSLLFVSRLVGLGFGRSVATLFIMAMALLVGALFLFLIELHFANRAIRIRTELLEQGDNDDAD